MSARSRQLRFLTPKKALSPAELRYFTEVDYHDHEALGALDRSDGRGVGIARYVRDADDPQAAEIAVTIVDDWQGLGLGTELVAQLSERARSAGIRRFTALIAADNPAMAGLLRNVRAELVGREPGALQYEITLGPAESTARLACLALAMIRQPHAEPDPGRHTCKGGRLCTVHRHRTASRSHAQPDLSLWRSL